MTRVLIVDDSGLARRMLRMVLETGPDLQVCGEAENGKSAIGQTESLTPDVVILDVQMPVLNGFAAAKMIHRFSPETPILMVSVDCTRQAVDAAKDAGAKGYIRKEDAPKALAAAVQAVLHGHEFFPQTYYQAGD